ncbi:MAG: WcaI family glycosyltransferase [Burkholderiales bacterium]|nr:WcaI family glycosyltransferase [Burkholderiales bacterium]
MKVLLYSANYAPEQTGIGKYSGDMAEWMAAHGHEVKVIAAPPYYPAWKVHEGYSGASYLREQMAGVEVWRAPIWIPSKLSGATRMLHLLSFAVSSLPILFRQVFWRPDVVMVVAPAFVCAPGALMASWLSGSKSWLHVQDFEVDVAFRLGVLSGGWKRRLFTALERAIFRRFDCVSSISERMISRAQAKGVKRTRLLSLPNWAGTVSNTMGSEERRAAFRLGWGVGADQVVAMYSGSFGAKHGLDLIPAAAKLLPEVHFIVCGEGVMRPELEARAAELSNLTILPLQPAGDLADFLGSADIHLLPQSEGAEDLVMPSKLTGMMASGRPTVATCRDNTEIARTLHSCGFIVSPGDVHAFADAIRTLALQPDLRREMGARARAYAETNLGKSQILGRLLLDLERLTGLPGSVDQGAGEAAMMERT